jgi:hypothetical protein
MGMAINNSLDWNSEGIRLQHQIHTIGYNPDLQKMFNNISRMIDELSKLEVQARRIHKASYTIEKVNDINKAIDHLDKLLLMARLMR